MSRVRTMFRITCLGIFVLAVIQVAWLSRAHSAEAKPEITGAEAPADGVVKAEADEVDHTAQELETKSAALETRSAALDERENRLKEREKEIDHKLKEMERLRQIVSGELEDQ